MTQTFGALEWAQMVALTHPGDSDYWTTNRIASSVRDADPRTRSERATDVANGMRAVAAESGQLGASHSTMAVSLGSGLWSASDAVGKWWERIYGGGANEDDDPPEGGGGGDGSSGGDGSGGGAGLGGAVAGFGFINPWIYLFFYNPPPPPPPPVDKKCCPVRIVVDAAPASGADNKKKWEEVRGGGGFQWKVDIEAWWREDDKGCKCDCCEVKQYVATNTHIVARPGRGPLPYTEKDVRIGRLGTDVLGKFGWTTSRPFRKGSGIANNPVTTRNMHLFEGFSANRVHWSLGKNGTLASGKRTVTFVEDVTFFSERFPRGAAPWIDPAAATHIEKDAKLPEVRRVTDPNRPGFSTLFANGHCYLKYTDAPTCAGDRDAETNRPLRLISRACNLSLMVVITPKRGCGGKSLSTVFDLSYAMATDEAGKIVAEKLRGDKIHRVQYPPRRRK